MGRRRGDDNTTRTVATASAAAPPTFHFVGKSNGAFVSFLLKLDHRRSSACLSGGALRRPKLLIPEMPCVSVSVEGK